jgi:hypothetical protein
MAGLSVMELAISLPKYTVDSVVRLHPESSPGLVRLIWESLEQPLEAPTGHAAFDGEELFCYIPPLTKDGQRVNPPIEDWTMWPKAGDLVFFHRERNERTGRGPTYELAFMYGETDLRHHYETGLPGSVVGHMTEGQEPFAKACAATRIDGQTRIIVARRVQSSDQSALRGRHGR